MTAPPPVDDSDAKLRSRLRAQFRAQRQALSAADCEHHGSAIAAHWLAAEWLRALATGATIALFVSQDGEPDTKPLLQGFSAAGYRLALPIIPEGTSALTFARYRPGEPLVRGRYGIAQPGAAAPRLRPEEIALVGLPLVAYDDAGTRLGMGGGYYDRWLTQVDAKAPRVGIAHALQRSAELLPRAHWDAPLDAVVTELGVTEFQSARLAGRATKLR